MRKLDSFQKLILFGAGSALLLIVLLVACASGGRQQEDDPAPPVSEAITASEEPASGQEAALELSSPPAESAEASSTALPGVGRNSPAPESEEASPAPEAAPEPIQTWQVVLTAPASLHRQPSLGIPLVALGAGQEFTVTATEDPLWYYTTLENGTSGYLYAECLSPAEGVPSLFEEYFQKKAAELKEKLPQDKYWNHMWDDSIPWDQETPWSVTDIPCQNWDIGEQYCNTYNGATQELFGGTMNQCLGFASLLSDQIFGPEAPLHVYDDLDLLRVGDHIRLHEYEHSMTVLAMTDYGVLVGECNENYQDCRISWNRSLSWEELRDLDWDAEYISRYPLCPDGKGGFAVWED